MPRILLPLTLGAALLGAGALGCGADRPANELAPETAAGAPPPSDVSVVRPGEPTPSSAQPEEAPAATGSEPQADLRSEAERAADQAVTAAEAEVEAAESALESARTALAEARAAALRVRAEPVSDPDVFRDVQRLLLEDPALSHVAIAAEVVAGVVILRGAVPDAATAEAAIELASQTNGVQAVRSELRLVE